MWNMWTNSTTTCIHSLQNLRGYSKGRRRIVARATKIRGSCKEIKRRKREKRPRRKEKERRGGRKDKSYLRATIEN